jgi:hypothetical protein
MKTLPVACFMFFLILIQHQSVAQQNPKTNSGKLKKNQATTQPTGTNNTTTPKTYTNTQRDSIFKNYSSGQNNASSSRSSDSTQQKDLSNSFNERATNSGFITINGLIGLSSGAFRTLTGGDWSYGFGVSGYYNLTKGNSIANLFVGCGFDYMIFGSQKREWSQNDPYNSAIKIDVTEKASVNALGFFAASRLELFRGSIVPFIEAAAGFRGFWGNQTITTTTALKSGYTATNFTPTTSEVSQNLGGDMVWIYGYGGGVKLGSEHVKLELKLMYMKGATANYIDPESLTYNSISQKLSFNTLKTETNLLIPQLGLCLIF